MTTVHDICEIMESFAPLSLQEDYDNSGLQIGNTGMEVIGILLCIDITEEVIDEALLLHCNMIISHHPLLFHGVKNIIGASYIENCIVKAIKNDIAIYSAHTNVDNVQGGTSWQMAKKLGLSSISILAPIGDGTNGCGVIGNLPQPITFEVFLRKLKDAFGAHIIRFTSPVDYIQRVALCGGNGSNFIKNAISSQADAYVTADLTYHDFFIQPNKILLVDIGHFESEQYTKEIFFEQISKKLSNFAVLKSKVRTNQINYI